MQATCEPLSPRSVMNTLADKSIITIDCRGVLRYGVLPGSAVLRKEKGERIDVALERACDWMMMHTPPDDVTRALVVDESDMTEDGDDGLVPDVVHWIQKRMKPETIYRIRGGAEALAKTHRFLFRLPTYPKPTLPSQLAEHLFVGGTKCAIDLDAMHALGITRVISILTRRITLRHIAEGSHVLVRCNSSFQAAGTQELQDILERALPHVLLGMEDGQRVLVHCEKGGASAAAAVACGALVAQGGGDVSIAEAAKTLAHCRPAAALGEAVLDQLELNAEWLLQGAPQDDFPDPSDSSDGIDEEEETEEEKAAAAAAKAAAAKAAAEAAAIQELEDEAAEEAALAEIEARVKNSRVTIPEPTFDENSPILRDATEEEIEAARAAQASGAKAADEVDSDSSSDFEDVAG